MAITTWAKAKAVLDLAAADETKVNTLIPLIESDYLYIRNRAFDTGVTLTVTSAATADGDVTVTIKSGGASYSYEVEVDEDDTVEVCAQKIAVVLSWYYHDTITVAGDVVTFIGKAFVVSFDAASTGVAATVSDMKTIYPDGAEMTAIRMIGFHMDTKDPNVNSESLGDYSVSFNTGDRVGMYPRSVTGGIKRYLSWT